MVKPPGSQPSVVGGVGSNPSRQGLEQMKTKILRQGSGLLAIIVVEPFGHLEAHLLSPIALLPVIVVESCPHLEVNLVLRIVLLAIIVVE